MASIKGVFSEGSLLRRTLIHVATFAIGSLAFIALLSFLLVTIATSILPSRAPKASADAAHSGDPEGDDAASGSKTGAAKLPKAKKPRAGLVESESPTRDSEK